MPQTAGWGMTAHPHGREAAVLDSDPAGVVCDSRVEDAIDVVTGRPGNEPEASAESCECRSKGQNGYMLLPLCRVSRTARKKACCNLQQGHSNAQAKMVATPGHACRMQAYDGAACDCFCSNAIWQLGSRGIGAGGCAGAEQAAAPVGGLLRRHRLALARRHLRAAVEVGVVEDVALGDEGQPLRLLLLRVHTGKACSATGSAQGLPDISAG